MNSKSIYDYLPVNVSGYLKQWNANTERWFEYVLKRGPEPVLNEMAEKLTKDEMLRVAESLKNNTDPMLYLINDQIITVCGFIRKAAFIPSENGKSLSMLVEESKKHPEHIKDIQKQFNKSEYLGRLAMNEELLFQSRRKRRLLEKRIAEDDGFKPIIDKFKSYNHIFLLAILYQYDRETNFVETLEQYYNNEIERFLKIYRVNVSCDWNIKDAYITRKTLNDIRERAGIFNMNFIPVPQDGLLGITESRFKHALSEYTKSKGMGLYSNVDGKETDRIEINLILTLFTAMYKYLEPMYEYESLPDNVPSEFTVSIEELQTYLYKKETRPTEHFSDIREKLDFTSKYTNGIINRNELLKVLSDVEINEPLNILTFESPLLSHIITAMLIDRQRGAVGKLRRRQRKENKKAEKEERDSVTVSFFTADFGAVVEYLEKPSLSIQRDRNAVAMVRYILQWIKSAKLYEPAKVTRSKLDAFKDTVVLTDGKTEKETTNKVYVKTDFIYWKIRTATGQKKTKIWRPTLECSTLIDSVPSFKAQLNQSKNQTVLLRNTFTNVWKYLDEHTRIKDDYPFIVLPGCNIPDIKTIKESDTETFDKWVPTASTKDSLIFTFEPLSKAEQVKRQIKQQVGKKQEKTKQ